MQTKKTKAAALPDDVERHSVKIWSDERRMLNAFGDDGVCFETFHRGSAKNWAPSPAYSSVKMAADKESRVTSQKPKCNFVCFEYHEARYLLG